MTQETTDRVSRRDAKTGKDAKDEDTVMLNRANAIARR